MGLVNMPKNEDSSSSLNYSTRRCASIVAKICQPKRRQSAVVWHSINNCCDMRGAGVALCISSAVDMIHCRQHQYLCMSGWTPAAEVSVNVYRPLDSNGAVGGEGTAENK